MKTSYYVTPSFIINLLNKSANLDDAEAINLFTKVCSLDDPILDGQSLEDTGEELNEKVKEIKSILEQAMED